MKENQKSFRKGLLLAFLIIEIALILMAIFAAMSIQRMDHLDGAEADKFARTYIIGTVIYLILFVAFASRLIQWAVKMLRLNLTLLSDVCDKLAKGIAIDEVEKLTNDEFGDLIDKINVVIRTTKEDAKIAEAVSQGDLLVEVKPKSEDDLLGNSLKHLVVENQHALSNISDAAMQVMTSASEVASASESLAQGSTEQASAIEEITASIDDVSDKTKENAEEAAQAAELMRKALDNMEKSNESMKEMVNAMNDINASSENISKIIKVIDDIAFQTNILALNAAVEAARAGDAGMGFAVVAEEVRNLAAKSSQAAAETAEMIEESIKRVQHGSDMADETAQKLAEVSEVVAQGETIVHGIAESSNYQATAIDQIDQAVSQVSQVVQTNSATSQQCAAASVELSSQADRMRDLLGVYNLGNGSKKTASSSYTPSRATSTSNRNEQIISLSDGFGKY